MSFKVPEYEYSSSPAPSTPDRKSTNLFFGASNPSTTPAGPPPSSARSFTPAGLPPSSYGGSMFGNVSVKPLSFDHSAASSLGPSESLRSYQESDDKLGNSFSNSHHNVGTQRSFRAPSYGEETDEEEDEDDGGEDYDDQNQSRDADDPEISDDAEDENDMDIDRADSQPSESDTSEVQTHGRSLLHLKETISLSQSEHTEPTAYTSIAAGLYSQIEIPEVNETDDVVIGTEEIITRLYKEGLEESNDDEKLNEALAVVPGELVRLWSGYQKKTALHEREEYTTRIGPGAKSSGFAKANFVANLALNAYQPQIDLKSRDGRLKPLPQAVLEWLNEYHDPYPSQLEEIASHRPGPSNHRLFWETVFNNLLRGKVTAIVQLLRRAGWQYAKGGREDLQSQKGQVGYTGQVLTTVESVVNTATDILTQCPAYRGDWDIGNGEWTLFRIKALQALRDLKQFAEGKDFELSSSRAGSYSRTAKQAQSAVPWYIYQKLVSLYSFVAGDRDEIVANAQDWCEASIGLFVWCDEYRHHRSKPSGRFPSSLHVPSPSTHLSHKEYLRKLRNSFEIATSEEVTDLLVDTSDPVEVALASVLEADSESVIGFLTTWSGPISSAVAEIGSLAGWLPHSEPQSLLKMSLDEQDLMVLGIASSPSTIDSVKDRALINYATSLTHRGELRPQAYHEHSSAIEGWELAIAVLGRLDSVTRSEELISEFLKRFTLDNSETVDKLWRLLNDINMTALARKTAETYANSLADSSHSYGEALWYYALAHEETKIKAVLDLLISYSLVQSAAYPQDAELDDYLKRLMDAPHATITDLSLLDGEAAGLLNFAFTGYATLRHFYNSRDQVGTERASVGISSLSKSQKLEAISALLTLISSANDNIAGGLYDQGCRAVISVDFLLALLGETMVFVNDPKTNLSVSDIHTLLTAVEDLQSVGARVYTTCNDFLQTVLASAQGLKGSAPADLLRKSSSNLSGSGSFSMVGSSLLASQLKRSMGSSGVLVKENVKRGWDWRDMLVAGNTADDILRVLRLGLAKKLADAWLTDVDKI